MQHLTTAKPYDLMAGQEFPGAAEKVQIIEENCGQRLEAAKVFTKIILDY
jgi:hypothetical protein